MLESLGEGFGGGGAEEGALAALDQKDTYEVELCGIERIGMWLATKQVRSFQQEKLWDEATVYAHLLHWKFL